ncbi:hypothetical protein D915_008638 [Fasciola hepatica]|uniref:Saposin B-type domain-containing protein n=1 Tax=Fasciola hepatica TaxID=6192 RepID=A0A2H1BYS1_FASHE|nr:hypothetical protein D915_010506 [Fasciola hepatica]THD20735.1 hypothetical protein D915_008638 [Fasciola hepatica]
MFVGIIIAFFLGIVLTSGSPTPSKRQWIQSVIEKCENKYPNCQFNQNIAEIRKHPQVAEFIHDGAKDFNSFCKLILKQCGTAEDAQRVDKRYMRMLRLG